MVLHDYKDSIFASVLQFHLSHTKTRTLFLFAINFEMLNSSLRQIFPNLSFRPNSGIFVPPTI